MRILILALVLLVSPFLVGAYLKAREIPYQRWPW